MLSNPAPWVVPWLRHDPRFERQVQLATAKVLEKVALKSQRRLGALLNGFCERKDNIFDFSLKGMANVLYHALTPLPFPGCLAKLSRSIQRLRMDCGSYLYIPWSASTSKDWSSSGLPLVLARPGSQFFKFFLSGQVAFVHDSSCFFTVPELCLARSRWSSQRTSPKHPSPLTMWNMILSWSPPDEISRASKILNKHKHQWPACNFDVWSVCQ